MEPEVCSNPLAGAAAPAAMPPTPHTAAMPGGVGAAPPVAVRVIDGRPEDRHVWAVAALVVPLVFCAIVGLGVFLMFHRDMGYFKPAPSGNAATLAPQAAAAGQMTRL